jgi:hypothetical protein
LPALDKTPHGFSVLVQFLQVLGITGAGLLEHLCDLRSVGGEVELRLGAAVGGFLHVPERLFGVLRGVEATGQEVLDLLDGPAVALGSPPESLEGHVVQTGNHDLTHR